MEVANCRVISLIGLNLQIWELIIFLNKFYAVKLQKFLLELIFFFVICATGNVGKGRDAGVVELARLESVCTSKGYRGFESLSLRNNIKLVLLFFFILFYGRNNC